MTFTVIIPARFGASRLPGKPLLDIDGKPMLQHTFERAQQSAASAVHIATDDQRIFDAAKAFGASVLMTADTHRSGTDRLHEAAMMLGLNDNDVVVNVQGDEPLIPPAVINQVAVNLEQHTEAGIATLCEVIANKAEIDNPNSVKVVFDKAGRALYFSRSTIPHSGSASASNCHRHIGIYGYRVAVLKQFIGWPPAELELSEKLEQLRALYNGVAIHVAVCQEKIPPGVDTLQDLELVREFIKAN
jgi:3-deoxy-manno-octulosonate cytidylyltransferase (CMP-KDO synthetase)